METKAPVHRPDEQLMELLDKPGTWVVHGPNHQVFGVGNSLRRAFQRAARYADSGAVVVAVARVPPNRIFVFHDQIVRLREQMRAREFAEDDAPPVQKATSSTRPPGVILATDNGLPQKFAPAARED